MALCRPLDGGFNSPRYPRFQEDRLVLLILSDLDPAVSLEKAYSTFFKGQGLWGSLDLRILRPLVTLPLGGSASCGPLDEGSNGPCSPRFQEGRLVYLLLNDRWIWIQ